MIFLALQFVLNTFKTHSKLFSFLTIWKGPELLWFNEVLILLDTPRILETEYEGPEEVELV